MATESDPHILQNAAALCGIEPDFWDIFGRHHITSPETQRSILRAVGIPADSNEKIQRVLEDRARAEWTRIVPPCRVVSVNQQPVTLELRVPVHLNHAACRIEVRVEDQEPAVYTAPLSTLETSYGAEIEGVSYLRKHLPLNPLALGYHEVVVTVAEAAPVSTTLIVTPDRAFLPEHLAHGRKQAGLALSLYGLRSAQNWGCGDTRDLRRALDWAATIGVSFLALNPLHAIHNRKPYNTSPYLPNSVFYQNPIYLDIEAMEDFRASPRCQCVWGMPSTQAELAALRDSQYVEYERVNAIKTRFLKLCFLEFLPHYRALTARGLQFQSYIDREGDLLDRFATYCALDEDLHRRHPDLWVWPDWPAPLQDPNSPETRAFQRKRARSILFHKYVQWQLDLQLADAQQHARNAGLPIGLYHDLALATDRCGSDLWAHRSFYVAGCRVGSPPDDFSPQGQDWAFPPPNSQEHYAHSYRLFIESIRKTCRHGGALRIDHVMRFFRLYWIPDGSDATAGAYVRDRADDLVRILALESVRQRVVVIGEDLGTVEPYIRETLARFGILSYRLLYFERNENGYKSAAEYPVQSLVSSTTHDLPTIAGFWSNADIEARRAAGVVDDAGYRAQLASRLVEKQKMLDALFREGLMPQTSSRRASDIPELNGDLHNAVIGFLASTPSMLLVVNQEDLTKEISQQNLPGTTWQYPNWSRKMKFTLEQLATHPEALAFVQMFRHWLEKSGRMASL